MQVWITRAIEEGKQRSWRMVVADDATTAAMVDRKVTLRMDEEGARYVRAYEVAPLRTGARYIGFCSDLEVADFDLSRKETVNL